jgi:hypothetical protein
MQIMKNETKMGKRNRKYETKMGNIKDKIEAYATLTVVKKK